MNEAQAKPPTYLFGCEWSDPRDRELCDCWCGRDGWHHQWKAGVRWLTPEEGPRFPPGVHVPTGHFVLGVDGSNVEKLIDEGWKRLRISSPHIIGIPHKTWVSKRQDELTDYDGELIGGATFLKYLTAAMGF